MFSRSNFSSLAERTSYKSVHNNETLMFLRFHDTALYVNNQFSKVTTGLLIWFLSTLILEVLDTEKTQSLP
jgi:hypothetical protein